MAMADETGEAAPAPKKKKGGLLKLILVVVVLLAVGGGGGAWWMLRASGTEAAAEPGPESRGLVSFEPFLVNLADEGGTRFLKASIQLVLETTADAKEVEETPVMAGQLRSTILELLTEQSAPELVTQEGKQALKDAIKARATEHLHGRKVIDVLFSEFVVQF